LAFNIIYWLICLPYFIIFYIMTKESVCITAIRRHKEIMTEQYTTLQLNELYSDGSGSKIFDPGRVSHLWFGLEFGKFPLKMSNFSIFFLRVKKNLFGSGQKVPGSKAGWPLIYCGSKVSLGRVRAHLYNIDYNSRSLRKVQHLQPFYF